MKKIVEKTMNDVANHQSHDYFPFTHGDNVEREREIIRSEIKSEYLRKQEIS
jgi:hypothetical protein